MKFLKEKIICKILKLYSQNVDQFGHENGFFYFNEKAGNISRVGKGFLYRENEVVELSWDNIKEKDLVKTLEIIKDKKFYFYKKVDNKFHKIRPKIEKKIDQ